MKTEFCLNKKKKKKTSLRKNYKLNLQYCKMKFLEEQ